MTESQTPSLDGSTSFIPPPPVGEQLWRLLTESATDVISLHEPDGTFLYVSPSCLPVLGYRPEELIGQSAYRFIHPDDAQGVLVEHSMAILDGRQHTACFRYRHAAGHHVWMEVAARIMVDPQATWSDRVVACGRDVTERHAAQLKLRDMASQWAAAQQRERRRIATGLHDDLGQLLALAKMKLDAMERGFEGAGSIQAVGELLADAIDRTRRLTFELCPPALYELGLEAALDALVSRLDADSDARVGFSYCCDARLLHDDLSVLLYGVARELLANALRHAAAHRIDLSLESNARVIRLDVRDDGVGMGSTGVKDLVMGGGFGLFSIREQLKPFGGELRLAPTSGGSHVQVTVPHGGRAP